jgi:hypothetical protein
MVKLVDMHVDVIDLVRKCGSLEMTTDGVVAALPAACSLVDDIERRGFTQPYAKGGASLDFPHSLHNPDVC